VAAGFPFRGIRGSFISNPCRACARSETARDQRLPGLVGDVKAGVFHAERIEDAFLLELIERLARHDLDTRPRMSVEWL